MDIGNGLKEMRKRRRLTLKELAGETGLSPAYLSNVENNATSPTLANLQKICQALRISMAELLVDNPPAPTRVLPAAERKVLFVTGSGIVYKLLFDQSNTVKITSMTIPADNYGEEMSWGHHDDELGIVAEGSLLLGIGEEEHLLNQGDFIYIQAHEVHKYKKIGEGPCTVYWIYVPE